MSRKHARPLQVLLDPDAPMCTSGKRGFTTEAAALAKLAKARESRSEDALGGRRPGFVEAGVYACAACGQWHLRSTTSRQRRSGLGSRDARRDRRKR